MFDGRFRAPIERAVKPVGDTLRRTRLTPDQLTMAGLVLAVAAAITIGAGYLLAGFILVVLAALPDMLDGALAKAAGASSQRGAYFDSVADRVTDMLLFGGVAWYFAADDRGVLTMLPVAVMGLSTLISYQRAKAESLGLEAKGGLMERAERIILLCLGLLVPVLLVPILWVMLALTAVHRRPALRAGVEPGQRRHRGARASGRPPPATHRPPLGPLPPLVRAPPQPRRLDGSGSRSAADARTRASSTSGWPATRPPPPSPGTCPRRSTPAPRRPWAWPSRRRCASAEPWWRATSPASTRRCGGRRSSG